MTTQADARYTRTTLTNRKCRTCKFFTGDNCSLIDSTPLPIVPEGSCIHWQSKDNAYRMTAEVPVAQIATDDDEATYEKTYQIVFEETGNEIMAKLAANGMLRRKHLGLAVKESNENDGITIAGWLILFGTPVIKDSAGTYFVGGKTEFFLDYYPRAPLWRQHGFDGRYKHRPIGYRSKVLVFKHGIWAEHKLHKEHPLYEVTVADVESGKLFYSSDSIHHFMVTNVGADGALYSWPLVGGSLVDAPAEPGLGEVVVLEDKS